MAYWEIIEKKAFWIQNMKESLETGTPTKARILICSHCKKEFGRIAFGFQYCPNCGEKIDGIQKESLDRKEMWNNEENVHACFREYFKRG